MEFVFCVMRNGELFAIYGIKAKAENIAKQMAEKYDDDYYVETRVVL